MPTFTELAQRSRSATGSNRILDGEIFRKLHDVEGDVWADVIGDDGVWYRRDREDSAAWDAPPGYTDGIDAALSTRVKGMLLTGLREHVRSDGAGPDWKPCSADISTSFKTFRGLGETLALAILDAILQAHAFLQAEEG